MIGLDGCLILVGFQLNSSDRILDVDPIPGVSVGPNSSRIGHSTVESMGQAHSCDCSKAFFHSYKSYNYSH